jgi:orotidine-5'-phosphate decarboxylase
MHRIERPHLPDSFSKKLETAFRSKGQLCVGIDPHDELLSDNGFERTPEGLLAFSFEMLDQLHESVAIVKPQVSFFERFGSKGFIVLEQVLAKATDMGFLVIADAKRGDIGSTMEAYAEGWLAKDAPFVCDALTLSPYLGVGALSPAIALASERGKGLFVLSATSNPEGTRLQRSLSDGASVASQIAEEVRVFNKNSSISNGVFGHVGLVVGATVDLASVGLTDINSGQQTLRTPILAPGFGHQGGLLSQAKQIFSAISSDVIYTISRSALRDGIAGVKANSSRDQDELRQALGA